MSSSNFLAYERPLNTTTLAILGCGNLGTALLCGILASIQAQDTKITTLPKSLSDPLTPPGEQDVHSLELKIPTSFMAFTRTSSSATRLATALAPFPTLVSIHHGPNHPSLELADIVVLGCQPTDLQSCLRDDAVRKAVRGKLLISLLAGITIPDIEAVLNGPGDHDKKQQPTIIIRAMPNTASFVRESMTVIEAPEGTPSQTMRVVDWLFGSIGIVKHIDVSVFDTCTALCASTPAFFAVLLEALVDGAVVLGLSRDSGLMMAAQAMKGTAELVLAGEHPSSVKEKITTPGGSTIRGVMKLEQGNVRAVIAGALIECKMAAERLGSKEKS